MERKMAQQLNPVYALATNITSSLGVDVAAHWIAVEKGISGIKEHDDEEFGSDSFWGARLRKEQCTVINEAIPKNDLSFFERLCLFSLKKTLEQNPLSEEQLKETVLILSSTKGNIDWLNTKEDDRVRLHHSAEVIASELGLETKPVIISHACVSGVTSLIYGMTLLKRGKYKHALVVGADVFSKFVLSGFQSFQAVAGGVCKPFDADRTGINLGEAAACILLSVENGENALAQILSGATSNDANHISGPSRTGEELGYAIERALISAQVDAKDIDMLSAHGTATLYNDEMEAKAFNLHQLSDTNIHSFKGYTGHTLGAAGVLESVMVIEAIQKQKLIPSLGYQNHGVSVPANITTSLQDASIKYVLKTASGFGGSNAAMVWAAV